MNQEHTDIETIARLTVERDQLRSALRHICDQPGPSGIHASADWEEGFRKGWHVRGNEVYKLARLALGGGK